MGKKCCRRETFTLIRLHILVEGQTEEGLINNILAPELGAYNVFADTHRITTGRRHGQIFRGGLTNYDHLARDLTLWMKQDQNTDSWFTTLIDFYGLPENFPGYDAKKANPALAAVAALEEEFGSDITNRLNGIAVSRRFIPYIQLHEFEALLFSDPASFATAFPTEEKALQQLRVIRAKFGTPEDIDTGVPPSKRILNVLPDYQKPVAGLLVAQQIGLPVLRTECPRFNNWVTRLIALDG